MVLILVNAVKPNFATTIEILNYVKSFDKEFLIIINKIDLLKKNSYLKAIGLIKDQMKTDKLITLSATKKIGINSLLNYIIANNKFYKNTLQERKKVKLILYL